MEKTIKRCIPYMRLLLSKSIEIQYYEREMIKKSNIKIAKPKVFIPVFTGTYGEYDMRKSFEKAGAGC